MGRESRRARILLLLLFLLRIILGMTAIVLFDDVKVVGDGVGVVSVVVE